MENDQRKRPNISLWPMCTHTLTSTHTVHKHGHTYTHWQVHTPFTSMSTHTHWQVHTLFTSMGTHTHWLTSTHTDQYTHHSREWAHAHTDEYTHRSQIHCEPRLPCSVQAYVVNFYKNSSKRFRETETETLPSPMVEADEENCWDTFFFLSLHFRPSHHTLDQSSTYKLICCISS